MSAPSPVKPAREPRPRDLENRFVAVTHDRLRRAFDTLSTRQQDVVEMIPLLFHLTHPLLPGYCGPDTPFGIADYTPTRSAVTAARRLVKSFTHESNVLRSFAIRGIYLMGSAGTVAYSRDSDLDIWICHDEALSPAQVTLLQRKAAEIEAFALTQGVEVHFYVFDAERFRRGETLSLSAESSGSSQHHLLLDEFYRSGLLLAGLKPLWWYVPPEEERDYDAFVERALVQRRISARHYVDFGGVPEIPAAEFFGAALWQLYKSIDSPYKSVMKLLLMESYAADYPNVRLLSHHYKQALSTANVGLDDLDPYLAMYRRVEEYLMSKQDSARLRVLRRAFYLKTDQALSAPADVRQASWRREIIESMVQAWGWTAQEVAALDRRAQWRLDTAREERRELVKALRRSYAVLSEFARTYGRAQHITDSDLNVLGRKLYAAFERKPHKLELITRGICQNPAEPILSLHARSDGASTHWALYVGRIEVEDDARITPQKQADSLVEVLAWCHFNRLADGQTEWHVFQAGHRQALTEVRRVLDALVEAFPSRQPAAPEMSSLTRAPHATTVVFIANVGCDIAPGRLAQGDVLTSSHSDAFQFGGGRVNLLGAIDMVVETSWGELYVHRYAGREALAMAMCEALERLPRRREIVPRVYCPAPDYGHLVRQRLESYVRNIADFFRHHDRQQVAHHVVAVGDTYQEICRRTGTFEYRVHPNAVSLLKSLGEPSSSRRHVRFDANCMETLPLATIYEHNRAERIQVFAHPRDAKLDLYVLDEFGDLYVERQVGQGLRTTFDHLSRFFESLRALQVHSAVDALPAGAPVEWYQLLQQSSRWVARPVHLGLQDSAPYVPLKMFADLNADGIAEFTCYCEEHEFSSREHGAQLFNAIATHILANRLSQEGYPVYITQLELSERYASHHGNVARRTVRLLEFKKRIEYHLTKSLRARLGA
ncbi:MAG: class I adenylate cyclase [Gammaproteobacteria bacterium]